MATTLGALTQVSVSDTSAIINVPAATAGTGPYTYQLYVSTTSGFSPGAGTLIAGATLQGQNKVTGLIPNTQYYFEAVATDSGSVTGSSAQLAVATAVPTLSQNQFAQQPFLGVLDLRFNYDTISVMIDSSQATPLYAGAAVKMVDSADGVPKVVGCSADTDQVLGFINYDIKTISFAAGVPCEISKSGNVMYLYATGAIARGAQVSLDLTTNGGVRSAAGNTGDRIVGWALDKAAAGGALIRVNLQTPSFLVV